MATVLAFAGGIGVQSLGRRLEARWPGGGGGVVVGLALPTWASPPRT
jgi:hypothetical protein